jgi:hypothetical protein
VSLYCKKYEHTFLLESTLEKQFIYIYICTRTFKISLCFVRAVLCFSERMTTSVYLPEELVAKMYSWWRYQKASQLTGGRSLCHWQTKTYSSICSKWVRSYVASGDKYLKYLSFIYKKCFPLLALLTGHRSILSVYIALVRLSYSYAVSKQICL